jgi:tRNA (guanine37-N1)-methyltransferase
MTTLDFITIFPAMFTGPFNESIMKRACEKGLVQLNLIDLREFTSDRHRTVDDRPYGGGAGMVMKPEPLFAAVDNRRRTDSRVILLTPQGQPFTQAHADGLAKRAHLILICGHYEGVDERVRTGLVDEEISIGDYVLTNGNLAAMVVADAVVRLLPGVLGCGQSTVEESFNRGLLEYPQYTRPDNYRGMKVPEILLSGDHGKIEEWRHQAARQRTRERRPDLIEAAEDKDRSPD